jgi:hypothetical protein
VNSSFCCHFCNKSVSSGDHQTGAEERVQSCVTQYAAGVMREILSGAVEQKAWMVNDVVAWDYSDNGREGH